LPSGVTHVASQETSWNARVAIIDLTNPPAVEWYKSLMRPVLAMGVDVFKTDFGEDIPADAVFANGMTGAEMHNLYPLLYNRAVFEVTQEVTGEGLVWSRSGYAGSQRYPTCWSGDPACTWDSLAFTIRGGLSLGLSGVPFWSNDIGGYRGHPSEALYIRWAQFGLLCSHARCHGESEREPWFYGDRATDIFRRYARLRYRLFPYLYSCAHEAARTGMPVLRAMPLAFPDDINACDKDLQYMLGPWLLVAPITDESDRRSVYLPAGQWTDYWTGETYDGPMALDVHAPLDTLPIFVRGGAILPGMAPALRISEGLIDPLIVDVYPHGASTYYMIEDEGVTEFSCVCDERGLTFNWRDGPERAMSLRFHGIPKPPRVTAGSGEPVPTRTVQGEFAPDGAVEVRVGPCRHGWTRMEGA
jgi:alpha-D-xyloside xylohydrolase